jgi:cyclase
MKKNTMLILIPLVVVLLASPSLAQRQAASPVELVKISDRLYEVAGGRGANGGAYIGDNGVLLIDAKMDQKSVKQTVEAIGRVTDKPIKYFVATHSDGDHIGGNRYLPETVTVIAHENCRKDLFGATRDGSPSEWNEPELAPFAPALTFRDKMDIHLGSKKVELWYFGVGHTTGDIVVYFPEEKTAFLGDQIFLTRPQLIHSHKDGNSFEHVKTLTRMIETLDAEKFCSGHSDVADRKAVENHIDQMKKRQLKVTTLVEEGKSLEEIKTEFTQDEARLIQAVYGEITRSSR